MAIDVGNAIHRRDGQALRSGGGCGQKGEQKYYFLHWVKVLRYRLRNKAAERVHFLRSFRPLNPFIKALSNEAPYADGTCRTFKP